MREEIELILEMLEEGKITTEDSAKLIEAIQKPEDDEQYETVNEVMDNMAEMTKHINAMSAKVGKEIIDSFESAGEDHSKKIEKILEYPLTADSDIYISTTGKLRFLKLDGEKSKIKVSVRLDGEDFDKFDKIVKINHGDGFKLEVSGYDKPVFIEVYLPDIQFNKVVGIGRNGKIEFDMINAEFLKLTSTNGKIVGSNSKVEKISLATTNAKIALETCYGEELDVATTNGKVSVSECVFEDDIDIATSNGIINLVDTAGANFSLATANGGIRLEDNKLNKCNLATSNGKIFIKNNDVYNDRVISIQAATSQGNITVLVPGRMGAAFKADTHNSGSIQLGKFLRSVEWSVRDDDTRHILANNRKKDSFLGRSAGYDWVEYMDYMSKKPQNLVYAAGESKSGRRGDTYTELKLETTQGGISIGWC